MLQTTKKGLFITFEGGEGSGKTTLIQKISKELTSHGLEVIVTREPGGSKLGEQIRRWLLEHNKDVAIGKQAELLLFLASRAQHIEELILPALRIGKIVLCDRFHDSTIAYQGAARDLGIDYVQDLCMLASHRLNPDLTFFLDVDPAVGMSRRENASPSGKVDRIESEKIAFHQKVQEGFHYLANKFPTRIRILNANLPAQDVYKQAFTILNDCFLQ